MIILYVYYILPSLPIGILYIGVPPIIFQLLLFRVFRTILNKDQGWIVSNYFTIFIWPVHTIFLSL